MDFGFYAKASSQAIDRVDWNDGSDRSIHHGLWLSTEFPFHITRLTGTVPQSGEAVVLRSNSSGQVEVVGELPV